MIMQMNKLLDTSAFIKQLPSGSPKSDVSEQQGTIEVRPSSAEITPGLCIDGRNRG